MTKIEKAIEKACQESKSLKTLKDLQDAYMHATQRMHNSEDFADVLIYNACTYAIREHALMIAEKTEADNNLINALISDKNFNWHEIVYIFMDRISSIRELVEKYIYED